MKSPPTRSLWTRAGGITSRAKFFRARHDTKYCGCALTTQKSFRLLSTWLAILVQRHQPTGTLESSCMNKVWQTPNFVINEWVSTLKSHYNPFKYPDKIQAGMPSLFRQFFMAPVEKIEINWNNRLLLELEYFEITFELNSKNLLIKMCLMQSKAGNSRTSGEEGDFD